MSGPVPTPLETLLFHAVRRVAENVTHEDGGDHEDGHDDGHSEFVSREEQWLFAVAFVCCCCWTTFGGTELQKL